MAAGSAATASSRRAGRADARGKGEAKGIASKKSELPKKSKPADKTQRMLYYAAGGAGAFVALLVGTAHALKRARRAARRRGAHLEAEVSPSWVLTENQIVAIAAALFLLLLAGVGLVLLGEQMAARWEEWKEARRERERRRAAQANKLAHQAAKKTGAALSAERAARRAASEAAARAEAEALVARARAAEAQRALEEAQLAAERAADDQAARKAAEEIDARTRAAAAAAAAAAEATSSAAQYTLEAWDVEGDEDEDDGEDTQLDLGDEGQRVEAPRMQLELNPAARGTEVCSTTHPTEPATVPLLQLGHVESITPYPPIAIAVAARVVAAWRDVYCTSDRSVLRSWLHPLRRAYNHQLVGPLRGGREQKGVVRQVLCCALGPAAPVLSGCGCWAVDRWLRRDGGLYSGRHATLRATHDVFVRWRAHDGRSRAWTTGT